MKNKLLILLVLIISLFSVLTLVSYMQPSAKGKQTQVVSKKSHWLILHRKSNKEFLYFGVLGDLNNSRLVRTFQVKAGVPGKNPTPLPSLLERKYWLVIKKESAIDNPETAPYFLTLNIPSAEDWPYGPVPYNECNGQCDWVFPGYFGLHGINGNKSKLSADDPGSSGCVRHSDSDITYLYNLLAPESEEIRYYIEDI